MKLYKLLKDLPTFKAGDLFVLKDDGCLYLAVPHEGEAHWKDQVMAYHSRTLERFPNILTDWFTELPDAPEEPKGTYFINTQGDVQFWDSSSFAYPNDWTKEKQIGNYFDTREEAEKAVEKLKAWQRLKAKGFRFVGWKHDVMNQKYIITMEEKGFEEWVVGSKKADLDLLFSQEDD